MIASLTGRLTRKAPDYIIIDVSGVGYQVFVPLSTFYRMPDEGAAASLHIHTHLREDMLALYGFSEPAEKDLFLILLGVSGIGPKLALTILSSLTTDEIVAAIQSSDDQKLYAIPGIGKKTAARMILELKDKVKHLVTASASAGLPQQADLDVDDAVSALMNLGYKRNLAEDAVQAVLRTHPGLSVENLIRQGLQTLRKR
ncbi:MAG: Holliday junction DNA helicase RuvA [Nitrospirae bacterium GWC2_56_14]|nr:MAG: Holliday junction DNA helicase RuvA [Nitrospirae bacterium GWC2_56_14]